MNKSSSTNSTTTSIPTPSAGRVNVRYDSQSSQWAVINEQGNPTRVIPRGVMKNVEFFSFMTRMIRGCAEHRDYLGIAQGELHEGATTRATGLKNLDFKGEEGFRCPDNNLLTKAKLLVLNPDRRAVFK